MRRLLLTILFIIHLTQATHAARLEVGEGKKYVKIEDAVAAASAGDEIIIYPKKDGSAYRQPAVLVKTPKLTIRAGTWPVSPTKKKINHPVILDGEGFNYSGRGSIPRAIFQFDPGADGCVLERLTLINARNESHNGAGVRINQANNVTIRDCTIHACDMGIMSNGEVAKNTGDGQLIEKCHILGNGTEKHAGYNHNLYLGGTSVTVRGCYISKATTGHNLKSRAHKNYIINNHFHHSANRELDLVDAEGNTDVPGSDAYVVGNKIEKAPNCTGNRGVIHFGKDGGAEHTGRLWLLNNTITTPFTSPVVYVSSGEGAVFLKNAISDAKKGHDGVLVELAAAGMKAWGADNRLSGRFSIKIPGWTSKLPPKLEEIKDIPAELKTLMKK